jgi:hypothetical protein
MRARLKSRVLKDRRTNMTKTLPDGTVVAEKVCGPLITQVVLSGPKAPPAAPPPVDPERARLDKLLAAPDEPPTKAPPKLPEGCHVGDPWASFAQAMALSRAPRAAKEDIERAQGIIRAEAAKTGGTYSSETIKALLRLAIMGRRA